MTDRFHRFTDGAREAFSHANDEAQRLRHNYIGTEHLLLGILSVEGDVASRILKDVGLSVDTVRKTVELVTGTGPLEPIDPDVIGLTPRAKRLIELAVDEARQLGHEYVGTEHLFLGLAREGEGVAVGVLESLNVNIHDVVHQLLEALSEQPRQVGTTSADAGTGRVAVRVTPGNPPASPLPSSHPKLRDLLRVIPVAQSRVVHSTTITLLSLELYGDAFVANFRVVLRRSVPGAGWRSLICHVEDDRAVEYQGTSFGEVLVLDGHWRLTFYFTPPLDTTARELRFGVDELRWHLPRAERTEVIETGPWTFVIPVTET